MRHRSLLSIPLAAYLAVFFIAPLIWLLSLSVRETEVRAAFPKTIIALEDWTYSQEIPASVYQALATDLIMARQKETLADAARRLNYEVNGVRSTLMRAARNVSSAKSADANTVFTAQFFKDIDPLLISPQFFVAIQNAQGPVSSYYLLSALDLKKQVDGSIALTEESNRIYIDVLMRTLLISATVTVICILLGFPVAMLLTQVKEKTADWLLVLVLLPFWTSLLVRTAAWVVVLQREGLVNSLLLKIGVIAEPLTLIYNRTGVLVAMTHVLLPFMILPLYSVLKGIGPQYMKAAGSLGAHPITAFFRVYLPMAIPGIAAGGLMVFILALGYYITPALVGGGADQMLSYFVASYTTETGNWGMAASLGVVMLLSTTVLYYVAHKLSGGKVMSMG